MEREESSDGRRSPWAVPSVKRLRPECHPARHLAREHRESYGTSADRAFKPPCQPREADFAGLTT
jgi:hypothetical protein